MKGKITRNIASILNKNDGAKVEGKGKKTSTTQYEKSTMQYVFRKIDLHLRYLCKFWRLIFQLPVLSEPSRVIIPFSFSSFIYVYSVKYFVYICKNSFEMLTEEKIGYWVELSDYDKEVSAETNSSEMC